MSYTPPSGDAADFYLSGDYTPPAGDSADFVMGVTTIDLVPDSLFHPHFLESSSITQVEAVWLYPASLFHSQTLESSSLGITHVLIPDDLFHVQEMPGCMVFEGIVPDRIIHGHSISASSITQTHFLFPDPALIRHEMTGGMASLRPDYVLPSGKSGGFRIKFGKAGFSDAAIVTGSRDGIKADHSASLSWDKASPASASFGNGWKQLQPVNHSGSVSWEKSQGAEAEASSSFGQYFRYDSFSESSWNTFGTVDKMAESDYFSPPPVQEFMEIPWGSHEDIEKTVSINWNSPPPVDRPHETLWGKEYYERICVRKYEPPAGDQADFNIRRPIELCGDEWHADFFFDGFSYDERCTQREPSGWRENHTYRPPKYTPRPPELGVYIVLNNAMLCRLPDRKPIEVLSMTLSSKIDSWCWDFRAVLGSASDFAIVKSPDGNPVPVEAEINGWKWIVMIEDSDGTRQFPKGSWSVSGRSRSAWLASPYAPVKTYTETQERLARQLAEAELEYTGWEFDWKIEDWLVPGNVFSVANQTAMENILKIVRAAGGEIQTDRTAMSLKAISRYQYSPWKWDLETPVIQLHESVIVTLGWQNDRRAAYNGIYVSGSTSGGVNVFVSREGSAGDRQAQMIVDPLITAVEAGRERGRIELARSGNWSRQRLSLPLMSGTDLPGLMNCGDLIEVQEGNTFWRGQVADVTVAANRQGGLKVYQNIEVERYHG